MADQDKTEKPTPKRRKEARKEGNIAKSPEIGMWLQVLVASALVEFMISRAYGELRHVSHDIRQVSMEPDVETAMGVLGAGLSLVMTTVLPLGVVMLLVGVVALTTQTGLVLATKAATPKFSKVNPISGLKRLVSPQGLWQGLKSVLKLAILGGLAWNPILGVTRTLVDAGTLGIPATVSAVTTSAVDLARTVALAGLALGIADYAYQRHSTNKKLKMSKQEIKDEGKQSEGDPQLKGQIRRRQQEMTQNRMLAGVADANVVIVNPTHIAVAIRYRAGHGAPTVIAKGRGHVADRIREEAAAHFVPIVRDVPLARTLEKSCKIDQAIPPELYEAVARLLAFVMQVGRRASLLGGVLENPAAARVAMPEPVG